MSYLMGKYWHLVTSVEYIILKSTSVCNDSNSHALLPNRVFFRVYLLTLVCVMFYIHDWRTAPVKEWDSDEGFGSCLGGVMPSGRMPSGRTHILPCQLGEDQQDECQLDEDRLDELIIIPK